VQLEVEFLPPDILAGEVELVGHSVRVPGQGLRLHHLTHTHTWRLVNFAPGLIPSPPPNKKITAYEISNYKKKEKDIGYGIHKKSVAVFQDTKLIETVAPDFLLYFLACVNRSGLE